MAQHVHHSWVPVVVLLVLAVFQFQLANTHVLLTRVSTFSKPSKPSASIKSVRLTDPQTLPPASESVVPKFGILVELDGTDLQDDLELSWSVNERDCEPKNGLRLRKIWRAGEGQRSVYEFQDDHRVFEVNVVYFCTKTETKEKWINLGKDFAVSPKTSE